MHNSPRMSRELIAAMALAPSPAEMALAPATPVATLATTALSHASPTVILAPEAQSLGQRMPIAAGVPFALLLLAIAVMPLVRPELWEKNRTKAFVSGVLALPIAIWLVVVYGSQGRSALFGSIEDYVSFIALLGSLYVISGGIHLKGSLAGTPLSNTAMLGIGALLANLIGTTGASMLLVRPLLRANRTRRKTAHTVVFFIFVVSNCGGLMTPLGDPPLFLGFLKGVPFEWTLTLWKPWLAVNLALLVVYNFVDGFFLNREERARPGSQLEEAMEHVPLGIDGARNVMFLAAIVGVIVAKGAAQFGGGWPFGAQELAMLALASASYLTTPRTVHAANRFGFAPIVEVALLFAGIFVTMTPPLEILNARSAELGLSTPAHYFWGAGAVSSFLDNAPTYLAFAAAAAGRSGVGIESPRFLSEFLAKGPEAAHILSAIACGAVMMGANTYIGNGPNFMVKAIAEEHGVAMPSFFGYMAWSCAVLLPIFAWITFAFFAG
jgi:Na+/H+ antiporter NhaD/arsenite permease-like protein